MTSIYCLAASLLLLQPLFISGFSPPVIVTSLILLGFHVGSVTRRALLELYLLGEPSIHGRYLMATASLRPQPQVQPISAELAVEVAWPADENTIVALQQLVGNLCSAALIPLAEYLGPDTVEVGAGMRVVRGDTWLLTLWVLGGLLASCSFHHPLRRSMLDRAQGVPNVAGHEKRPSLGSGAVTESDAARAISADALLEDMTADAPQGYYL